MRRPDDGYAPPTPQTTMAAGLSWRMATVTACAAFTGPRPSHHADVRSLRQPLTKHSGLEIGRDTQQKFNGHPVLQDN